MGIFVAHCFFCILICLDFGVWETLGAGGRIGGVILVLRIFPELVGRPFQNLAEIGLAVHM